MLIKKKNGTYYDDVTGLIFSHHFKKKNNGNGYWYVGPKDDPSVPAGEIHGKVFFNFELKKIPGGWRFVDGKHAVWLVDVEGDIDIRKEETFDTDKVNSPPGELRNNKKIKAVWGDDDGESKVILVLEIEMRNKTTGMTLPFMYKFIFDTNRNFKVESGQEDEEPDNGDDPGEKPDDEKPAESDFDPSFLDYIGMYFQIWRRILKRFKKGYSWFQYTLNVLHALVMGLTFPFWLIIILFITAIK